MADVLGIIDDAGDIEIHHRHPQRLVHLRPGPPIFGHGEAGLVEQVKDGGGATVATVNVAHRVRLLVLALDEIEDPVFAGIFAGHEGSPCRWRDGRQDGLQRAGYTAASQLGQIGHAAFRHPRADHSPGSGVEADYNDFRLF